MKIVLRSLFFLALAAAIIYFMYQKELIDFSLIGKAFVHGQLWLILTAVSTVVLNILMMLRYERLLKNFGIKSDLKHVSAATFVSNAIGQWAPGSVAVIELLRVGLMVGADNHERQQDFKNAQNSSAERHTVFIQKAEEGLKSKLAISSLFDRMLGFFAMLSVGACTSFYFYISAMINGDSSLALQLLPVLGAASAAGTVILAAVPLTAHIRYFEKLFLRVRDVFRTHAQSANNLSAKFAKIFLGATEKILLIQQTVRQGGSLSNFMLPLILSYLALLSSCFAIYFSGIAIGFHYPFISIMAVFPMMALSSLLPIGFGGIGGQQVIAIGLFSIFSLNSANTSQSMLLYASITLLVNTVLGLIFGKMSAVQIKAILNERRDAKNVAKGIKPL